MTFRHNGNGTLAGAIIDVRQRVGSQAKLADRLGTTERTVKRWERGSMPRPKWRPALIRLGVDAALFERVEGRAEIERRVRILEAEIAAIRQSLR